LRDARVRAAIVLIGAGGEHRLSTLVDEAT